ncbi:heterokaryon incompatibility, partial [Tricladium varicosporioides]
PPYTALPYNWGDQTRRRDIILNSSKISITQKSRNYRSLTLWINALCIDQNNDVEKSEQIQWMRQIYSQAKSVTTWLG